MVPLFFAGCFSFPHLDYKSLTRSLCQSVLKPPQSAPCFWWGSCIMCVHGINVALLDVVILLMSLTIPNLTPRVPSAPEQSLSRWKSWLLRCLSPFWVMWSAWTVTLGRGACIIWKKVGFFTSPPAKTGFMWGIKNPVGGMVKVSLKLEEGILASE